MLLALGASGFLGPALRGAKRTPDLVLTYHAHAIPGGLPFGVPIRQVAVTALQSRRDQVFRAILKSRIHMELPIAD